MAILESNIAHFTFAVTGLEPELRVVRFTGSEGLSQLFRFSLELASDEAEIDFSAVVGKPALLTIYGEQGERYVNGIVSRFEQAREGLRLTTYHAELVPQLWLLSYRHKSRTFQHMTVPDIIAKILDEVSIPSDEYRFVLQNQYLARDYCVQYRESELNFISRLMEEEGIFYFFEHSKDGHVLVIGDSASAHVPILDPATVIFHEPTRAVATEEYVYQYRYAEEVRPGAVMLRDYDFKKPQLSLQVDSQSDKDTTLEIYDYPGEYEVPENGTSLARIRLEEFQTTRRAGKGKSVCRRFTPGYRFTLDRHPRASFNQEYVLTQVTHTAAQPQALEEGVTGEGSTYANEFECIPSALPFRPPRITAKPIVKGSQTAIVVGPGGEEIYTDEHGRVKVQFHWDREGKKDQNSSCWIRVSQAWAGAAWGGIHIPRIGQEVVVDFLEGDPDRPIIIGRVYHGTNTPPYDLPANQTQSGIKTRSTKGGGAANFNEIRFEDKKASEELYIHAEKDENTVVEHDQGIAVGNDRVESIKRDRSLEVGRDKLERVERNKSIQVAGNHTENINRGMTIVVGSTLTETVAINYAETVGAAMELTVGAALAITVGAAMAETVGAAKTESIGGLKAENIGDSKTLIVGKNLSETIKEDQSVSIGKDLTETVAGKHREEVKKEYMLQAKKIQVVAEDEINIKTGKAEIIMKKNGDITIKGNKINIKGSGDVIIKGSKIAEN